MKRVQILEGVLDDLFIVYLMVEDASHRVLAYLEHYHDVYPRIQEYKYLILKEDLRKEGMKIFWYLDGEKLRQKEMENRLQKLYEEFLEPIKLENPEMFL